MEPHRLSITALRKRLFQVVAEVSRTGVPVEFEAQNQIFYVVAKKTPQDKLLRLEKNPLIKQDDDISNVHVHEWHEPSLLTKHHSQKLKVRTK